jgi:hypothetical protein
MVPAARECTSDSCASAIYMPDAHLQAMGILTRQESRTRRGNGDYGWLLTPIATSFTSNAVASKFRRLTFRPSAIRRKRRSTTASSSVTTNICGSDQRMVRGRTTAPAGIAVAVAVFGALSLLIVDHGLWNRPYVESSRAHAATEAAVKADGALTTPTRKPSLYSRIVRRLR